MITVTTIDELRSTVRGWRERGATVGVVPTMGFLHAGHASLIDASVRDNDATILTIFVNPTQFAPDEDLSRYPRDIDGDTALAREHRVDVIFLPDVAEMYPVEPVTTVSVRGIPDAMEGRSRPTHFDGVATVVAKLLNICGADRAYFGEKDFQQLAMVRRVVADLNHPTAIVGCPTLRHDDGLAMSSRNVYLSEAERRAAPVLYRALMAGRAAVVSGATDSQEVIDLMEATIVAEPLAELDYVAVADSDRVEPVDRCCPGVRLLGAVRFSAARLIDNIGTGKPEEQP